MCCYFGCPSCIPPAKNVCVCVCYDTIVCASYSSYCGLDGGVISSPSPEPGSPFVLFSFFHFIRRFWNHILIWRSVRHNAWAISMRRRRVRYRLKWNSFSSSSVWYRVYVWRPRFRSGIVEKRMWISYSFNCITNISNKKLSLFSIISFIINKFAPIVAFLILFFLFVCGQVTHFLFYATSTYCTLEYDKCY